MFANLTSAFGFTVLCLPLVLLVGLIFPFILMRFTRSKEGKNRNPVTVALLYARLYVVSLVVMVMVTIAFWWAFLTLSTPQDVADFASQSIPLVNETAVEEAIEPAETLNADEASG